MADGGGRVMRTLLAIPILFLASWLTVATVPPEEDPPASPERKAMDKLYELCRGRDAEVVRQAYEQIAKDFPGKDVADEATYGYALFQLWGEGRLDKAQDLFLSLKRSGHENRWVSRAVFGLTAVTRKRKDERAMLGYLEEAANAKADPTSRNFDEAHYVRQEALMTLGRHYRGKGDFKKALDYFTRWESPQGGCGTCELFMRLECGREITVCRLHLGDHAGIARESLIALQKYDGMSPFHAGILCRLYGEAGQLDDLRRMVDDYDKTRKPNPDDLRNPNRQLRELLHVEALAREKNVAALVDLCQDESKTPQVPGFAASVHSPFEAIHSAAAEALGSLDAVDAVRSALAEKPYLTTWLVYALWRSNSPAALQALAELAEQQPGKSDRFMHMTDDIAYSLALKGEPGRKVLKRFAEKQTAMGESAREWIEKEAKPDWPEATWPHPKAGSLPKTLPDPR
jgi:tetratricopeptide (TPR) repeat protein